MDFVLTTQRLLLQPVTDAELDIFHQILTDSYVRRYLCDGEILPLEEAKAMLEESQRLFREEKLGIWLIKCKNNQQTLGFTCLWYFFAENQPQLGYALLPEATKQGYATEASQKILEYAFTELQYKYLVASCDRPNIESQRLAERIGMKVVEEKVINDQPIVFLRIDSQK